MTGRGKLLRNILNTNVSDTGIAIDTASHPSLHPDRTVSSRATSIRHGHVSPEVSPDEGVDSASISSSGSSNRARGRFSKLMEALSVENTEAVPKHVAGQPQTTPALKTESQPKFFRGDAGSTVDVAVNYVRLLTDPDKGVYEYEVRTNPVVASKQMRHSLLMQHKDILGNAKTFDGATLLLPFKLNERVTTRTSISKEGVKYEIEIIFKRQKSLRDCIYLYGILFDRISKILKMVRYKRKQFDPSKPFIIPQHKLEIWPGHVTAVDEYEGGVMLCMDVSFRVLNTRTVYDLLEEAYGAGNGDHRTKFEQAILGAVVLTRYNNNTYRVDEVLWDKNPSNTFATTDGRQISYREYYQNNWAIKIKDLEQPLLLHHSLRRVAGKDTPETIQLCLIPEICHLTGLTDTMRADFKIMKDVASFTRVTPNQRIGALKRFIQSVKENDEAKASLACWGLRLDESILNLSARVIQDATIKFKNNSFPVGAENSDFNSQVARNEVIDAVDLMDWLLVYPKKNSHSARKFVELTFQCARPMGIGVSHPQHEELLVDNVNTYVMALKRNISKKHCIVVIIVPSQREDRYAAIKRVCCSEIPIPSQVINARTLSDDKKVKNVVCKILLQMNCKMGGSLWGINIPMQGTLIIGVDTYHDADKRAASVAAFVSSIDSTYSKWFSRAVIQKKKEELMNGLNQSLVLSIQKYHSVNGSLPGRIVLFRDGVGDGQISFLQNYEVPQLKRAWSVEYSEYIPEFLFVIVQKRINTRIILNDHRGDYKNPPAGTVLDHTVTRKGMYDFFLVPQNVKQGTVTPTHYIVLHDSTQLKVNIVQNLAYRLCFQYYNWPGAVKVPAPCQYAHKLAYLVGQYVKRPVANVLDDKLFYL